MANKRRIVPAPTFTPSSYGLWSTVDDRSPGAPDHWRMGITWEEWCPQASTTYDQCIAVTGTGPPPPPPAKTATTEHRLRGATPFTVVEEVDCSSVGFYSQAEQQAIDALTRSEMRQVEEAFFSGVAGGQTVAFPHLAADAEVLDADGIPLQLAADELSATPVEAMEALGRLEAALGACYGGVGVIHVTPLVADLLIHFDLVQRNGAQLRTTLGNLVAVGAGYTGNAPDGTVPATGTQWMYATGALFGYRSDIFATRPIESFDRSVNTVKAIAERTYVLGFECCLIAIPVNTDMTGAP